MTALEILFPPKPQKRTRKRSKTHDESEEEESKLESINRVTAGPIVTYLVTRTKDIFAHFNARTVRSSNLETQYFAPEIYCDMDVMTVPPSVITAAQMVDLYATVSEGWRTWWIEVVDCIAEVDEMAGKGTVWSTLRVAGLELPDGLYFGARENVNIMEWARMGEDGPKVEDEKKVVDGRLKEEERDDRKESREEEIGSWRMVSMITQRGPGGHSLD